jgi:hypothetical protein
MELKIVLELSNRFPDLELTLDYEKSRVRLLGSYECSGGEELFHDSDDWHDDEDDEQENDQTAVLAKAS